MSRLAPALRIRHRQLDALRLAIAAERQRALGLAKASTDLSEQRQEERRSAYSSRVTGDAWFAASARRLAILAEEERASAARLALLRARATDVRARLSLLEEADRSITEEAARAQEARNQAALDDRTASGWARRR